ncbi:MAG: hypothetical protein IPI07_10545 [Flavobacteriales bacterium]|nr:hypothetical protein [Flavobacteriales bacterium]
MLYTSGVALFALNQGGDRRIWDETGIPQLAVSSKLQLGTKLIWAKAQQAEAKANGQAHPDPEGSEFG